MKTCFLLVAVLLLVNTLFVQSPQESPELKEATELTESAVSLFQERKYDTALSQAKKALAIRERLLPRTDLRISRSLFYVGDIYIVKRDFDDAKKVFERLLEIQTERSGPNDVSLASTFDRLALIYYRTGNKRKTEEMYARAFALREQAFGADSVRVAESLYNLGEFYRLEGDYDHAATSYKRSLLIYGKRSGIESSDFERVSDSFLCLGYKKNSLEVNKELNEIRKQFAPPQLPQDAVERRVLNGMAISLPKPDYPIEAYERRLSGMVVVKVVIDETGKVINAHDMCQGPPILSQSSVAAALKARFTPTKLSGAPVKVNGIIQYRFVRQ